MKTQKKFFIIVILLALVYVGYFAWSATTHSSNLSLENKKAKIKISANNLLNNYHTNEDQANQLYSGKIIQITGTIKDITFLNDRTTIILNTQSKDFGVICDLNKNQENNIKNLYKNQNIIVKGVCKGHLKDVILLNCTIEQETNE